MKTRRLAFAGLVASLLLSILTLWPPHIGGDPAGAWSPTPIRLPYASWAECHGHAVAGPYWSGSRWLVDVQRHGGTYTAVCRRTVYKRVWG